jgi:hypothetical protein
MMLPLAVISRRLAVAWKLRALRPQGALRVLRFVGKGGVHGVGTVFAVSAYVGRPGVKNMGLGSQLYKLCGRQSPIHYQKLNSIGTRASCSQSRRLASQNADPNHIAISIWETSTLTHGRREAESSVSGVAGRGGDDGAVAALRA